MGLLLCAVATTYCTKDDYVEPEFITESFSLYASFFNHSSGGANINPTYMTPTSVEGIMDLSQGDISHEWSFWSGSEYADATTSERTWTLMDSGVNFIMDNSNMGWGEIEDYSIYLDSSIPTTNSRDAITFMIPKGGAYKLRIRNTYSSMIRYMFNAFDDIDIYDRINEYSYAEPLDDGSFEVIKEYEMMVYESLYPVMKIYSDASYSDEIDMSQKVQIDGVTNTEITIAPGTTLYFDNTTGEDESGVSTIFTAPTDRTWTWSCYQTDTDPSTPTPEVSPSTSTSKQQGFLFDTAGIYRVVLKVERTAADGASTKFPTSTSTLTMPIVVYVI